MADGCKAIDDFEYQGLPQVFIDQARTLVHDARRQLNRDRKARARKGCAYCGGRIDGRAMGWSVCSACNMTRSF